jgi:flagellar protein FliL
MAVKDDELELDTAKPSGGGKGKLIVILVVVMLLTTSIVIGVLYFMGGFGGSSSHAGKDKADKHEVKEAEPKELVVKPAFYLDLQPAFVVNFEDQTHAAYLQVEMQIMARDKEILDTVVKHMPVIRNNILLILSAQKYETVKTRKGKEDLQETLLEAIQKVIGEANPALSANKKGEGEASAPHTIEQVYFTSFIMQ